MAVRQLTKIRTGNADVDRAVAHIVDTLNPVLRTIPISGFRWQEIDGTNAAPPTFALQVARGSSWTTILTIDSTGQILSPLKAEADAAQEGTALGPIATGAGWADVPGTAVSFTPRSSVRKTKAVITVSGFVDTSTGTIQFRLVLNGVQIGPTLPVCYNAALQHQAWTFQWIFAAGLIGTVGKAVTIKAQVQVPSGTARFNMDVNDSSSLVVEEIG